MRIVTLYRSGYRNGYREGEAVCGRWQPPAGSFAAVWQQQIAEEADCRGGWDDELRATQARLDRWTPEASLRCAEEVHAHRLGHLPDLSRYPELRGMDQYLDDYYHGYADGADISFPEALLQTYWYDVKALAMGRAAGNLRTPAQEGCSELIMARTPYGPIVGQGCDDWPPQYPPDAFTAPLRPSPPEEPVLYVYEDDEGVRAPGPGQ
jgi:hypothetical protein